MIEKEKINEMLSSMGGMKNFRDFRKSIKRKTEKQEDKFLEMIEMKIRVTAPC